MKLNYTKKNIEVARVMDNGTEEVIGTAAYPAPNCLSREEYIADYDDQLKDVIEYLVNNWEEFSGNEADEIPEIDWSAIDLFQVWEDYEYHLDTDDLENILTGYLDINTDYIEGAIDLGGYNPDTMRKILYYKTGYRSFSQVADEL